jgi:hypothetical protein
MQNFRYTINNIATLLFILLLLCRCQSSHVEGEEVEQAGIIFSHNSGHYKGEFELKLEAVDESSTILYTLDGTLPTKGNKSTFIYKGPFLIQELEVTKDDLTYIPTTPTVDSTYHRAWKSPKKHLPKGTVVRAQVLSDANEYNSVVTKTYFADSLPPNLSEIYLTINKESFFDYDTGIYVPGANVVKGVKYSGNFFEKGKEWERRAHLEFISKSQVLELDQDIGVRIHGLDSPEAPLKSLRLYARKKYGKKSFDFEPFEQTNVSSFKRLVLRTPYSTFGQRFFADQLVQRIVSDINIECASSTPTTLYINGEYWGILDMTERIDERYFKSHFNINPDSLGYSVSAYNTKMGGSPEYYGVFQFLKQNNLSIQKNYDRISELIDIDNFIDYMIIETYLGNVDWPDNNNERWRENNTFKKWRWILIDMDAIFFYQDDQPLGRLLDRSSVKAKFLTERLSDDHTLIFQKLVQNKEFKSKLILRYEELLSSTLCPERIIRIFEDYEEIYKDDIQRQIDRWGLPKSEKQYYSENKKMKERIRGRKEYMIVEIEKYLGVKINPVCDSSLEKQIHK